MSSETGPAAARPRRVTKERLDSWKEIAAYLKRGERTVQRWEREQGLPVRRLTHNRQSSVYAYTADLDAWWQRRSPELEKEEAAAAAAPARKYRWWAVAALAGVIALGVWLLAPSGPSGKWVVRPLTSYPGTEYYPSLSPDGSRVAFSWNGPGRNNFDVYVMPRETGAPVRLTSAEAPDVSPAWSPDGRWIAFVRLSAIGSPDGLYVVPASGGAERLICSLMVLASSRWNPPLLAWTPDGRYIAAGSQSNSSGRAGIILVQVETGKVRDLVGMQKEGGHYVTPAFSPDGKWLAYTRCQPFNNCNVFVMELGKEYAASGAERQLTSGETMADSPVWAAGGREVLFAFGGAWDSRELGRVPLNGLRKPIQSVHGAPGMQTVTIGGRGGALVYSRETFHNGIWGIEVTAAGAAAGPMKPILPSIESEGTPDLSPGGDRIAFPSSRSGNTEIWVADRNGGNAAQLTKSGDSYAAGPRWSPDGTRLVFALRRTEASSVCVVRTTGGLPECLVSGRESGYAPTWSRDGASIYFVSSRSGSTQLWKIPTGGGPAVQVTKNGAAAHGFESPDGRDVYYVAGDAGLWRVPAEGGPATLVSQGPYLSAYPVRGGVYLRAVRGFDDSTVSFLRYGTAKPVTVATVPNMQGAIAASADGRIVLFSRVEGSESDLMLVEAGW